MLAKVGALNDLSEDTKLHRRDALWQVEKAVRKSGPLLEGMLDVDAESPLLQMTVEERLVADYHGTGLTTGPHPMAYRRDDLRMRGIKSASELRMLPMLKAKRFLNSAMSVLYNFASARRMV